MTKEARLYNEEKTISSLDGTGKLDIYMQKINKTRLLSYNIYKNKLKMNKKTKMKDLIP